MDPGGIQITGGISAACPASFRSTAPIAMVGSSEETPRAYPEPRALKSGGREATVIQFERDAG